MFNEYRNRMAMRGKNMSEMLRRQSNLVIEHTWDRDPNYRQVYVVRVNSGLPEVTAEHELIDVKFNIKTYQSITADEVSYSLQFRHGEEKRHPEIALGSYVYMEDDDGNWKWWLLVHEDERPSFRQWQILECNWTLGWVANGVIYRCLCVQRYQNSYNSGSFDLDRTTAVDNITAMWMPSNDDTRSISYNQRFLVSDPQRYPPIAWTTSKYEDTTPVGLVKIKLTQETFDPAHDSHELMLANYYDSVIEPIVKDVETELMSNTSIVFSGAKPTVKVGGSFKTFTPVFHDESVAVEKWTVSDENGDVLSDFDNYIVKYDGDKLKLKVVQNYYLIGKKLIVQVYGTDGSTAEIGVEVIG